MIRVHTIVTLNILCIYSVNSRNIDNLEPQSDLDNLNNDDWHYNISEIELVQRNWDIYPRTKWCGNGHISESYDDLGPERELDMCCRDHDHCKDVIHAGETSDEYGLTNSGEYSKLSCECDEAFRECLHVVGGPSAYIIGGIYFNYLGTQCFKLAYPATCERNATYFIGATKCVTYYFDVHGKQSYQWFDVNRIQYFSLTIKHVVL